MKAFLARLEPALKEFLKERYLPEGRFKHKEWVNHDLQFFARGADFLSTAFTEERKQLPQNYFNKKEFRSAYLLYFTLINAAKVWHCLHQASELRLFGAGAEAVVAEPKALRILDLGCGPLTASLACADFFRDRPVEILALEQNRGIAKDGLGLWKKLAPPPHRVELKIERLHPKNISALLKNRRFDLAIAANFLSELPFNEQIEISKTVLERAKNFVVIEPALQKVTRAVMALRDRLVAGGGSSLGGAAGGAAQVIAPCPHQQNCPMLAANKRDWCHFYIDWKCPLLIRQVDQIIGNKHDYLKMAYMIFTSLQGAQRFVVASPAGAKQSTPNTWRVVSSPLISAGKKEFILCGTVIGAGSGRLQKITRLNKHRNPANISFDQMKRGDVIEWNPETPTAEKGPLILKKF